MKHTLILAAFIAAAFTIAACKDHDDHKDNGHDNGNKKCLTPHKYHRHHVGDANDSLGDYLPIDSANKMLSSYLNSIQYQENDTDIYDLIYDADSLRKFLTNARIKKVKFMFAHTLDYINDGGKDQYAGYQSGALTIIVSAYDKNGNYVYTYVGDSAHSAMVMDHCCPCPMNCPTQGSASSAFLVPENTTRK